MASTLVRGKYVIGKITGSNTAEVISDGAVFQQDGEIIEVGRYADLRTRHTVDEILGSSNHLVMPGLINAHFHVGLSPFQRGSPDLPLELWMADKWRGRDVGPYLDNMYGAALMLKAGVTTTQVLKHYDRDAIEKALRAYRESGMRVCYGKTVSDQSHLVSGLHGGEEEFVSQLPADLAKRFKSLMGQTYLTPDEHISMVEELCMKYADNHHERVRVVVAPSNVHRCSDNMLLALKQLAVKHNVFIQIHLQETVYQKLYGLHAWGKTPLQHLNDLGFLGSDVTCAHSVWATDSDIEVMAATGTNVCHLASSNLRLQSGIAPVNRFLKKGIRIAIGSDEAGLNDDKDMLQEMRLVLKLHREPGMENLPPTGCQVFQMATVNGAHISGFGDRIGTLEPGKRADLVLMNLHNIEEPYLDADVSIVDAVVHRGRSIDVETVMVDGEVVLRDGQLTGIDEELLFKEIRTSLARPLLPHEMERNELSRQIEPYLRRFYAGTADKLPSPHYYYNARS
ncbi:amidohydrolase family protein [Chloroflexota bacterium]